MSEEILVGKKKKKKTFDLNKAVEETMPLVQSFRKNKELLVKKCHEVYWEIKDYQRNERANIWNEYCERIGYHPDYVRSFFKEFPEKYPLWHPEISERNAFDQENLDEQELEPAVVEDELETEYDTHKYQETFSILNNAQRLSANMFRVVERDDLIKKLQKTIKHLTTLLLKLESNIDEE